MTWDQVAAFRLSRHFLLERAPARALVRVLGAMGGAQAQIMPAAYMSLWARARDVRVHDIEMAADQRAVARAWCMRRTLHLVPSEDLAVFTRGTARRAEREVRWLRGRGVTDGVIDRLVEASLAALEHPRSGPDLVARVAQSLGVRVREFEWGGWASRKNIPGVALGRRVSLHARGILHVLGARAVVCYGPGRGAQPTFVRADAWVPRLRDLRQEDAEDELLERYLRAFGPAAAVDFSAWTGMALSDARAIWRRRESDLAPVSVEGWTASILRADLRHLKTARSGPLPVRLLPYFDSYLLGHKARAHLVERRHHKTVYRPAGWISPVVLVDGRIGGLWSHARDRERLLVRVTKLTALSRRAVAGIRDEAERLAQFLDRRDVRVQMA
ncbi:MAG TPA: winged helix DNA-binding domain-containing protein [bacterium]|nr:winged helix DNA-binding domain-containing protein [bacterium]